MVRFDGIIVVVKVFLVGSLLGREYYTADALSSLSRSSSSSSSRGAAYDLSTIFNAVASQTMAFSNTMIQNAGTRAGFANGVCGGRLVSIAGLFRRQSLLLPDRDITVWLPPSYDDPMFHHQYYSVIYCHDGQNAIEDRDSWTGASWRLAGAVMKLVEQQCIDQPPILVLIPSANGDLLPGVRRRHLEYASLDTSPFATAHTDLVAQVIKPTIDRQFRTYSDAAHTFAMGTSMGGQASMNLLLKYPNLFGGAACLSPYFSADTIARVAAEGLVRSSSSSRHQRIYLDIGGDTATEKVPLFDWQDHLTPAHWWNPGYFWLDTSLQESVNAMNIALTKSTATTTTRMSGSGSRNSATTTTTNLSGDNTTAVQYRHFPGARHNERAWARRIHWPLLHLLGSSQH